MSTIKLKRSSVQGKRPIVSNDFTNELDLGEIAINTHDGKMFMRRDEGGNVSLHEVGNPGEARNVLYVSLSGKPGNSGKSLADAVDTIDKALELATPVTIPINFGAIDATTSSFEFNGHVFVTGDILTYSQGAGGSWPSLVDGQQYYVRKLFDHPTSDHMFQLYETAEAAFEGNSANAKTLDPAAASGTNHTLTRKTEQTTIFVKSGTYELDNTPRSGAPMGGLLVPKNVSIVGDNLRTTKVKGKIAGNDLFYVQNASYLTNMTFIGMQANLGTNPRQPAAASFPPIALQEGQVPQVISTSPYVENCTAFNTTATGMLIDGSLTRGLRSMVSDSFTQINAGGTGVHILNRGYAQLVSIFTVSCEHAVLCESGGQCSLTNSNASFGTFGLKATGASENLYSGITTDSAEPFGEYFEVSSPSSPKYGDAFYVEGVSRKLVTKCSRDVGIIVNAVANDLVLNTNYNSSYAGIAYQRADALPSGQVSPTAAALSETKRLVGELSNVQAHGGSKATLDANFDSIINIINNGTVSASEPGDGVVPALTLNNTLGRATKYVDGAGLLVDNRSALATHLQSNIAATNPGLTYDQGKCERDVKYIIDALCYDLIYGGNSATRTAAKSYFVGAVSELPTQAQKDATATAYTALANFVEDVVTGNAPNPDYGLTASFVFNYTGHSDVALEAKNLVLIIQSVIEDDDLGGLPTEILPDFSAASDTTKKDIRTQIISAERDLRLGTTDFVVANTDIGTNAHYSVESFKSSINFTEKDYNGYDLLQITDIPNNVSVANSTISGLQRTLTDDAGNVDSSLNIGHGLVQGQPVRYNVSIGGTPIPGLTAGQVYYVVYVDDETIKLATNPEATIIESLSAASGTGTHTFTPKFFYNATKCQRDVGLIVDAVADDVLLNTNFNSIYTGVSYQRASAYATVTNTDQKNPTLSSMLDVKRQLTQIEDLNEASVNAIKSSIDRVVGIFLNGTGTGESVLDKLLFPNSLNRPSNYVDAVNILREKRSYIEESVISDINSAIQTDSNNPSGTWYQFTYDENKCRRDLGYLIDALCYDLMYNNNAGLIRAANSYRVDGTLQLGNTTNQTIEAYDVFLRNAVLLQLNTLSNVNSIINFDHTDITDQETVTSNNHGFNTGDAVVYTEVSGGTMPALQNGDTLFVIRVDDDTFKLAGSLKNALASQELQLAPTSMGDFRVTGGINTTVSESISEIVAFITAGSHALPELAPLKTTNDAGATHPTLVPGFVVASSLIADNKAEVQNTAGQGIDIYRINPLETITTNYVTNANIDFKKRSLIAASSMTFEYVGTGTEIQGLTDGGAGTDDLYNTPRNDDFPKTENEVIQDSTTNLGAVYFTSTDHKGDFRIGTEMNINRTAGRIEGDAFNRSLFSVMTPYILAIEGN